MVLIILAVDLVPARIDQKITSIEANSKLLKVV